MFCYIRKYVIIGGIFPLTSPPTKKLGVCVPGSPGGVDASAHSRKLDAVLQSITLEWRALL